MVRMQKRTLSTKGQIVVPKDIRERLNLKPGSEMIFEIKGKELLITPKIIPREFVEDFIRIPKKLKKIDMQKIKEIMEEEYEVR